MLTLLLWVARIAVALIACATGLGMAETRDWRLRQRRGLWVRSLVAVLLLVPLAACWLVSLLRLPLALAGGLLISAIAIGPVAALKRSRKHGQGEEGYALGLDLVLLVGSILYVPAAAAALAAVFGHSLWIPPRAVAKVVLPMQLAPLALGLVVGRVWPRLAARLERPMGLGANLAFLAIVVLVLIKSWRAIAALGPAGLAAVAALAVAGVIIGHVMGGPGRTTRSVLVSFCALRFPALALVIARASPDATHFIPVILAYTLISMIALAAYLGIERMALRGESRGRARAH